MLISLVGSGANRVSLSLPFSRPAPFYLRAMARCTAAAAPPTTGRWRAAALGAGGGRHGAGALRPQPRYFVIIAMTLFQRRRRPSAAPSLMQWRIDAAVKGAPPAGGYYAVRHDNRRQRSRLLARRALAVTTPLSATLAAAKPAAGRTRRSPSTSWPEAGCATC